MPQLIDIPNYGTVEFPDGMNDAQITAAIQNNLMRDKLANNKPSRLMAGVDAFNNGVERTTQGALQPLYESGLLGEKMKQSSKDYAVEREARASRAKEAYPIMGNALELAGGVGSTLPLMAIPGIGVGGAGARLAANGSIQGALASALQYVPEGGSRGINTLAGGALGAVIPYAANKLTNAFTGQYADDAAKAVIDQGEKFGVPVFASDAANTPKLNATAQALEEVPVIGMRGPRQAQMMAAKNAAENLTGQYSNALDNLNYGGKTGISAIQEAANSGGKRAYAANKAIELIDNTGNNINDIIKTSGNVNLLRAKLIADKKYSQVGNIADKLGSIDQKPVIDSIDSAIKQVNNSGLPNNAVLSTLSKLKENLQGNQFNYSGLRNTFNDLGGEIKTYYTGQNALVGQNGVQYLQQVKNSIGDTLDNFAKTKTPGLKSAWQSADNFYKNAVIPYKNSQIASVLKNEADPDKIYSTFITNSSERQTGKPSRLYSALDDKGKAAVKYGMVDDAFNAAFDSEKNTFSPARFATEIQRKQGAYNVFFKAGDKAEIDGFTNLMRHVERANIAVNKPETGVKALPFLIGGAAGAGAILNPVLAAKAVLGAGTARILMTTNAGRRLLLASSKAPPGSPVMQNIYNQAVGLVQRGSAVEAADKLNK